MFSNTILPSINSSFLVPESEILLLVSIILKILFAATIPICNVLNLSAI